MPVLVHSTKKPGCAKAVRNYFSERVTPGQSDRKGKAKAVTLDQIALDVAAASAFSAETPSAPSTSSAAFTTTPPAVSPIILVIGDRVMTDVVLANRINKKHLRQSTSPVLQALPVLTTSLWQKEGLGTRLMRVLETFAMRRASAYYRRKGSASAEDWRDCVLEPALSLRQPAEIRRARRPVYQVFSKAHFNHILSRLGRGIFGMSRRLLAPFFDRLEPILKEARQAQFGFRLPQSYQRAKALREVLDGRSAIPTESRPMSLSRRQERT